MVYLKVGCLVPLMAVAKEPPMDDQWASWKEHEKDNQ